MIIMKSLQVWDGRFSVVFLLIEVHFWKYINSYQEKIIAQLQSIKSESAATATGKDIFNMFAD